MPRGRPAPRDGRGEGRPRRRFATLPGRGRSSLRAQGDPRLPAGDDLLELAVELGGRAEAAVDDLPLAIDQDHRRERDDAVLGGEPAVHPARLEDLRPGTRVLLEEALEIGFLGVEADADDLEAVGPILLV